MGILNLTPDSFVPSSRVSASEAGFYARKMIGDGADIIDVGAYSSRPGAEFVGLEEEWSRIEPALDALKGLPLSFDTSRAEIVRRLSDRLGHCFAVNDISAGDDDPEMLPLVRKLGLRYIAMHKRGTPETMDSLCEYEDGVMPALESYFEDFARRAEGIDWVLDPGLGFAKTPAQCIEILENLGRLKKFGRPLLIGASGKRFTLGDTASANRLALENGADILRVHNIIETKQLIQELC